MSEDKKKPAFRLAIKPVKDHPLNAHWPCKYQGKPAAMGVGAAWPDQYGGYSVRGGEVYIDKDHHKLPPCLYVKFGDQYFPLDNFYVSLRSSERKKQEVVAPVANPFASLVVGGPDGPVNNPFAAAAVNAEDPPAFVPPGEDAAE